MSVLDLAKRFFNAIETGDLETVRNIYHPDVVIWHNFDPIDQREIGDSREQNLKVLEILPKIIIGAHYHVLSLETTETGFTQQHLLQGVLSNGEPLNLPACITCKVEGGRITRLDEYMDTQTASSLIKLAEEMLQGHAPEQLPA